MDNMYSLSFPSNFGIGFEEMFNRLSALSDMRTTGNYPPYNIIQENDTECIVEMAVAGFSSDDLDIEVDNNKLTVIGKKDVKMDDAKYRHQGIAYRNFSRSFALADHIEVNGASVNDGVLRIYLEQQVPEELKPKKIEITSDKQFLSENSDN
tara:strand:+ start:51 stop:506 length:456 start_codon:yes stop_codon:yes gene_type:complete